MESMGSDAQSQGGSPEQLPLVFTPGTESRVDLWQQTGSFPYPDLNVFPPPSTQEHSKTELRLMHHLSSISNDLLLNNCNNLTLWTHKLPKSVESIRAEADQTLRFISYIRRGSLTKFALGS